MAISPVTSYADLVQLFKAGSYGKPLDLGPVNWTDPDAITAAIQQKMGRDGVLWIYYIDGDDDPGEARPVTNPGHFVADITGGNYPPAELGITIHFYQLDETISAAIRTLVPHTTPI